MANNPHVLDWIQAQHPIMVQRITRWAKVNSWTYNRPGLDQMLTALKKDFSVLAGQMQVIDLPGHQQIDALGKPQAVPLGKMLSIKKRGNAKVNVFLGIHMDTVHRPDSLFCDVTQPDDQTLVGPGVADAKGGLAVMLTALQAFEQSEHAPNLGWQVLINSDEEVGSPGSASYFAEAAKHNDLGMVFEPALPDGSMIHQRKGSGNFTLVIRGKAAHAGRHLQDGRNALDALADFSVRLRKLPEMLDHKISVNLGQVQGGGPVNIVPDLAIGRFNVRVEDARSIKACTLELESLTAQINQQDGYTADLFGQFTSPPKVYDTPTEKWFDIMHQCSKKLNMTLKMHASGGVCDGNKLAEAGLPTIDTLGPVGGQLHSNKEYVSLPSLTQRAKLTALMLMTLAEQQGPNR